MKCEHCGKNEVTFVYRSNINGKVDEKHLCADCAEKLGYTKRVAAQNRSFMRNFFSDDFFGGSLLDGFSTPMSAWMGRMLDNPFDDFFSDMPALCAAPSKQREEQKKQDDNLMEEDDRNHYDQWRKLNALKLEMGKAVQEENFERAAELRDEIKRMEQQNNAQ